jgi:hypothetical protein
MSQTNRSDVPLFQVRNHHSASRGPSPHIDAVGSHQYLGYFENQHGEQAVFIYHHDSHKAVLYLGDAGWETPHAVVDGAVPDLILSDTERLWLRACWQAADRKEGSKDDR